MENWRRAKQPLAPSFAEGVVVILLNLAVANQMERLMAKSDGWRQRWIDG